MFEPRSRLDDRYELLEAVASNGAYAMWRCCDLLTGAERSVTVVQSRGTAPQDALGRVLPELDAIARLADPQLIPAVDVVCGERWIAIVTRALPTDDLSSLMRNHGSLPPVRVAMLGAQLCDALAAAHAIGLAHGHLTPSAVRLEPGADGPWTVRLNGFGISSLIDVGGPGGTRRVEGSIDALYQAYEILDGEPASAAADVYAVGVMMYEALIGRTPAPAVQGDSHGRLAPAEPLPIPAPTDQLGRLVSACLERNPRDRPTASYLADRLRAFAASSDVVSAERIKAASGLKRLRLTRAGASAVAVAAGVLTAMTVSFLGPGRPPSGTAAAQVVNPLVPIAIGAQTSAIDPVAVPRPTPSTRPTASGALPASTPSGATPRATASATPVSTSSATSPAGSGVGGGARALFSAQSRACLDTNGGDFANGTKEQIWTCNDSSGQGWTLSGGTLTVDGGAYCLDVFNNQTADGATVDLWHCNGGQNQRWSVNSNGTITGIQSGKCLDVTGQATANGTQVELWTCNGGQNQQWSW
jgi:hypothetical protein